MWICLIEYIRESLKNISFLIGRKKQVGLVLFHATCPFDTHTKKYTFIGSIQ